MSKTSRIWLIIGAVLVVIGVILFTGVMVAYDWDFTKLSTAKYAFNTYKVNGKFDKISINVDTTEIEFLPTDDKECSIVCFETEKVKHIATVQNDILMIDTADTRKWYEHIGIFLENPKMTVYLPQKEYVSLIIETDTGDISVPKDFSFETLKISGDTSDVELFASIFDTAKVEVSTGDINVDTIKADNLSFTASTGDINLKSVTVNNDIEIRTDTGNIKLNGTTCANFVADSNTGEVEFKDSDAKNISVKTSTGDVTGTLLSEKVFITETSTGSIRVPKTTSGGKCEINTSTGDIKIDITH